MRPNSTLRRVSVLLLIASCYTQAARAAQEKTADLIIVSGGSSFERWKEDKYIDDEGKSGYFALGTILIAPRTARCAPLDVKIWGRGVNDIVFFELTPLADALDGINSAADLRQQLLPSEAREGAQPPAAQSDAQRLQAVLEQSSSSEAGALRWRRQTSLEQMKLFGLKSFEELWALYEKQSAFARKWWGRDLSPPQLMSLWQTGAAGKISETKERGSWPSFGRFFRELSAWPSLLSLLRDSGRLSPVLRTQIFAPDKVRTIGYLVRVPKGVSRKATSEVFVAATGAEATSFSISLEVEHEDSIFESGTKIWGAVFSPGSSALLGVAVGLFMAAVGNRYWLSQQKYQRRQEIDKLFKEKKAENSSAIWKYFNETYKDVLEDVEIGERDKVLTIREGLMKEGIYAIMPYEEIEKINDICEGRARADASPLNALHSLLRANFGEFIRGSA